MHVDAEHNYNRTSREAVYRFFATHLHPERASYIDQDVEVPPEAEMLAFSKSEPVPNVPGFDEIFERWKASAVLQMQNTSDPQQLREALQYALGVEWPLRVESRSAGGDDPAGASRETQ